MSIRGVLFDSGGTLTRPLGGRWNPRFDFEEVLLQHVPEAPTALFPEAFAAGQHFLERSPSTPSRDDYHRVVLSALGIDPPVELLHALNRPLDVPPVEPYPEVLGVLVRLRSDGIRMALVTDNWGDAASVRRTHDLIGLAGFFTAFAVSAELGCIKPDPRMYRTAADGLGLASGECLFVDDDPALVEAAIHLGYHGAALCRDGARRPSQVPAISTLDEVPDLIIAFETHPGSDGQET